MNPAPDSERPAEASDPVLEALRQRLGPSFGHEPSPAVWAGIRQQLPPAPAQPWWRRPRRLLPLLLLLLGLLTVGLLTVPPLRERAGYAGAPATRPPAASATSSRGAVDKAPASAAFLSSKQVATSPSGLRRATAPRPTATEPTALAATGSQPTASLTTEAAPTQLSKSQFQQLRQAQRRRQWASSAAALSWAIPRPPSATSHAAATRAQRASAKPSVAAPFTPSPTGQLVRAGWRAAGTREARRPAALGQTQPALAADYPADVAASVARRGPRRQRSPEANLPNYLVANAPDPAAGSAELLTGRVALLPLPDQPKLPMPLVADTIWRGPVAGHRWSVLVLAGPALSYRTTEGTLLISQPSYAAAPVPTTTPTNTSTFYGRSTSALLERPALGWGAQVQVRRVLSGRWALALGLGYQEYATQLTLTPSSTLPSTSTAQTLHLRDTYQLLTAPVQLGYALGPPRGRLALGLLAGAEPGWYRGGRSTEASSCNCQQQQFSQADGSPYNAWTVALSLGLDLRYQVGGPASRWQLLVQPTGRYIATPFVRAEAGSEYLRRQPYSLGLLTGVAWSWH